MSDLLKERGIGARQIEKPCGTVYALDRCLTSTDHDDAAAIIELKSGALVYRCLHDSCAERSWADVRGILGRPARDGDAPTTAAVRDQGSGKRGKGQKAQGDEEDMPRLTTAIEAAAESAAMLADFARVTPRFLNGKVFRVKKEILAHTVSAWLIAHERLLIADDGDALKPEVFLVDDDGAVIPLDGALPRIKSALARIGINAAEPMYAWMVNHLLAAAVNGGARRVHLERYVARRGSRLFISCGPTQIVVADAGGILRTVANGFDGVLFTADAVLPPWDPEAAPVDPLSLAALQPNLEAPSEVPEYAAEVQRLLLRGLLVAMLAGLRPLPSIVALGGSDGGKTTLSRAITRLILGGAGDICDSQVDARDFASLVSSRLLVGIDNLDGVPQPWLHDAVATAVTGGQIQRRELYTNSTIVAKQITACLLITSRTAAFANRADIMERLCPLFVISPTRRLPESELFGELASARDGALVWLARMAAASVARFAMAPDGLPGRFVDWARIVWALDPERGVSALEAMARAQQLAIADPDPLAAKIVEYLREHEVLEGVPKDIVAAIDQYRELEYLGGGKSIARRLRELAKGFLPKAGVVASTRTSGNAKIWVFRRAAAPRGRATGGETENTEDSDVLRPDCHSAPRAGAPAVGGDVSIAAPHSPFLRATPNDADLQGATDHAPGATLGVATESAERADAGIGLVQRVLEVIEHSNYAIGKAQIAQILDVPEDRVEAALVALDARGVAMDLYHDGRHWVTRSEDGY